MRKCLCFGNKDSGLVVREGLGWREAAMKFKAMELESYVKFLCSFKGLLPIVVNFSWFLSVYKKGVVLIFNAHLIFFFFVGPKKSSSTYLSYKATDIVHVSNSDFPIEILLFIWLPFLISQAKIWKNRKHNVLKIVRNGKKKNETFYLLSLLGRTWLINIELS